MKEKSVMFIRPKNSSYEKYVRTIKALCNHLEVPFTASDEELRLQHKKFLAKKRDTNNNQRTSKRTSLKRSP